MTYEEFQEKWRDIRTEHAVDCPRKFSFDFEPCTCGLSEEWKRRNEDLQAVETQERNER